jgi:hypothetical protein
MGKKYVHFLHIGKTGGTSIGYALKPFYRLPKYIVVLHSHSVKLDDIPLHDKVFFMLREPISRFVSAFFSRKRKGYPRYYQDWSAIEQEVFTQFDTPNQLAEALLSTSQDIRNLAQKGMKNIFHVRNSYLDWFKSIEYFESRKTDIFYIGFQETLQQDFENLKRKLSLPKTLELPTDPVKAHISPEGYNKKLSESAISVLTDWYAKDIEFYQYCKNIAPEINTKRK